MSISYDGVHLRNASGDIVGSFFYIHTSTTNEEGEIIMVPQPGKYFMVEEIEEILEIMYEEAGYEYDDIESE